MLEVFFKNGQKVVLNEPPLGSGGEGAVYSIKEPISYSGFVAKIFWAEKVDPKNPKTKERFDKLDFMIRNPPKLNDAHSVIWPKEILYKDNFFVGFLMPKAVKGERLSILCLPKIKPKYINHWQRFSHSEVKSELTRIKVCYNICAALSQIHSVGKYVLVDFKPDNILIEPISGKISIIDTDSSQISENGNVLFRAPVTTPDYQPAEITKINFSSDCISVSWDNFSLAVVLYQVLFGIHPFSGSCKDPFDNCNEIADMVKNGLFANGQNTFNYFSVIPPLHNKFKYYPISIQFLFEKCFGDGHNNPNSRPNSSDWCKAFSDTLNGPSVNFKSAKYFYVTQKSSINNNKINIPPAVNVNQCINTVNSNNSSVGSATSTTPIPKPLSNVARIKNYLLFYRKQRVGYFLLSLFFVLFVFVGAYYLHSAYYVTNNIQISDYYFLKSKIEKDKKLVFKSTSSNNLLILEPLLTSNQLGIKIWKKGELIDLGKIDYFTTLSKSPDVSFVKKCISDNNCEIILSYEKQNQFKGQYRLIE